LAPSIKHICRDFFDVTVFLFKPAVLKLSFGGAVLAGRPVPRCNEMAEVFTISNIDEFIDGRYEMYIISSYACNIDEVFNSIKDRMI
jgi:hypothetical protein